MFHYFPTICFSPVCGCGEAEQTVFHIVLECKGTSISNASKTIDKLKDVLCRNINNLLYKDLLSDDFSSVSIDYSRDANGKSLLVYPVSQRVQECFAYLNITISLPQWNRLLFYLLNVNRLHLWCKWYVVTIKACTVQECFFLACLNTSISPPQWYKLFFSAWKWLLFSKCIMCYIAISKMLLCAVQSNFSAILFLF